MHMTPEEVALLAEDRAGKQERPAESETRREKVIEHMENWYEKTLKWWMDTQGRRKTLIWAPIIATIISFFVFSPRLIGVSLFPSDDSQFIFVTVAAPPGTEQNALLEKLTAE